MSLALNFQNILKKVLTNALVGCIMWSRNTGAVSDKPWKDLL